MRSRPHGSPSAWSAGRSPLGLARAYPSRYRVCQLPQRLLRRARLLPKCAVCYVARIPRKPQNRTSARSTPMQRRHALYLITGCLALVTSANPGRAPAGNKELATELTGEWIRYEHDQIQIARIGAHTPLKPIPSTVSSGTSSRATWNYRGKTATSSIRCRI